MTHKIIDDVIGAVTNDIKRVQTKPTVYISKTGAAGALHLAKETINNMIDECTNKNSIGKDINVYLDETENLLSSSDNSRGIPFDKLKLVCTVLHSGSKITREGTGGASAGENGVGITAINALSEFFELRSSRNGEKAGVTFNEGVEIDELKIDKDDTNSHGTTCSFIPSKRYLGDDAVISGDELYNWINKISHTVIPEITMTLDINRVGKEASIHKEFKNINGMAGLVSKLFKKEELTLEPNNIFNSTKITEVVKDIDTGVTRDVERFLGIEIAFAYRSNNQEIYTDSFCNNVNTELGGKHLNGAKDAIQRFFKKKTIEALSDKDKSTLEIKSEDVYNGLILMVNINTELNPEFVGQTKDSVGNLAIESISRNLIMQSLTEFMDRNPRVLKKVIEIIKQSAKNRLAILEVRKSVIKGETSNVDKYKMDNFIPCNARGKQYKELIIVEGDSAKGTASNARFNDHQALYILKGVPSNVTDKKGLQVLATEFRKLITILGCNFGAKFDINKLEYDKIIILSDADVDGMMITSSLSSFFIIHLPEIVSGGYLYKGISPLYKINNSKNKFVIDKGHYIEIVTNKISSELSIFDGKTDIKYNDDMLKQFLSINRDYLDELTRISKSLSINSLLLERIIMNIDSKDLSKEVEKYYPEITIDNSYLSGVVDGKFQVLVIDKIFYKKIKSLIKYIHEINKNRMILRVCKIDKKGKIIEDIGKMTIGEFMILCQKFNPEILMRYKGLGELQSSELRETTLDPNTRFLYSLTISDLDKEVETFKMLHGEKYRKDRASFMKSVSISREEFDN